MELFQEVKNNISSANTVDEDTTEVTTEEISENITETTKEEAIATLVNAPNSTRAKTGDPANIALLVFVMIISIAIIGILLVIKIINRQDKKESGDVTDTFIFEGDEKL